MDETEDSINKYENLIKNLKNELGSVNETYRTKEIKLLSELEIVRQQFSKLESNINSEGNRNTQGFNDIVMKLKNDHTNELNNLREEHQRKIHQLKLEHLSSLKDMESQILLSRSEDSKTTELNGYISKLEFVIKEIRERLKAYYEMQKPLHEEWKGEDDINIEEVLYTEFIVYTANKYAGDNKWLTEKLAELQRENQNKSESEPSIQIFNEVIFIYKIVNAREQKFRRNIEKISRSPNSVNGNLWNK